MNKKDAINIFKSLSYLNNKDIEEIVNYIETGQTNIKKKIIDNTTFSYGDILSFMIQFNSHISLIASILIFLMFFKRVPSLSFFIFNNLNKMKTAISSFLSLKGGIEMRFLPNLVNTA